MIRCWKPILHCSQGEVVGSLRTRTSEESVRTLKALCLDGTVTVLMDSELVLGRMSYCKSKANP